MANSERQPDRLLTELNTTMNFIQEGQRGGFINQFTIRGPLLDEPVMFTDFVFLYPELNTSDVTIKSMTTSNASADDIYREILKTKISERINKLGKKNDESISGPIKGMFVLGRMPHITIALGKVVRTKDRHISLFSIIGISPEKALATAQKKISERKSSFN